MTTYADLITGAATHLRAGATPLRTRPFDDPGQALAAMADYQALLAAIASHARALLWPTQVQRIGRPYAAGLPPIEDAATSLATGIERLLARTRAHPSQVDREPTSWSLAAQHLRAASDLLATHYLPDGRARTPDAAATTAHTLEVGLADLGHLAGAVLAVEEPLALRALQAQVDQRVVARHLPGLAALQTHAQALSTDPTGLDPLARYELQALGQTPATVSTTDPIDELAGRMRRLRHHTFHLPTARGETIATLRDLTVLGTALHAHAAAFHGAKPMTAPDPGPHARGAQRMLTRGRIWQALHHELAHFAALTPPLPQVREDVIALSQLLPRLAPLDDPHNTAAGAAPADRRTGAALNGALTVMADIAGHNADTLRTLTRTHDLLVEARHLPRDLVTDNTELIDARLNAGYARAPEQAMTHILKAYDAVATDPFDSSSRPVAGPSPAERAIESGPWLERTPAGPGP